MPASAPLVPQPPRLPLLGNLLQIDGEKPVQSMVEIGRQLGPFFRIDFPGRSVLIAGARELVDELCDERRFGKFVHTPLQHIRDFAGDGLFTAHNEEPNWARAHSILMPAFGPHAMRGYFEPMLDVAQQLVTKWERLGPDAELDVPDNMTRLTLDTIALCGFGYRFNSFYQREMHPFVDAMVRSLAEAGARSRRPALQTRLMRQTQRQYADDIAFMNGVVDEVIAERRAHPQQEGAKDLLSLMLEGRDPATGERLDDVNIRHQIVTFLIAGHETTSGLLSFALYELLRDRALLARAQEEVDRVLGRDWTIAPKFEQLSKLTFLDQVLRETLRLWPTAPAFAVSPKEDTTLANGAAVKKGDVIMVLTPLLHRDPETWTDPERFDPGRFSPERAKAIPANAWKPFGNGQRACIGRQFAMQEALLVLALVLQRFELFGKPSYALHVKETLTLKPEGLTMRVRQRRREPRTETPVEQAASETKKSAPVARHGTPLLVLFGSNSGSSEAFARRVASDGAAQGYASTVAPMDEYAGRLPTSGAVVIVTASYNGRPPNNAARFCAWLDSLAPNALSGVRFAVFGCGHRDWAATYQAVPQRVDAALVAAGAERLVARGEADARGDFFGEFDGWYGGVWKTFGERFSVAVSETDFTPEHELEWVQRGGADPLQTAYGLASCEVLENRELVDLTQDFARSKRHIALRLPEGTTYRAGDHLAVLPSNPAAQVERVVRRFQLDPQEQVVIRRTREGRSLLPLGRPIAIGELLARSVELSVPASKRDLQLLARHTQCPPEKQKLLQLAEAQDGALVAKRVSVLDLLEQFPACELPFALFLELLPAMKPRRYSISSSPLADPRRCTITVAVVDAPAWSGHGRFLGACSNHLQQLAAGDELLAAVVPHEAFRLPEDPQTPVVLVGAGTGLAPLRGFLEERARLHSQGIALGAAQLFFGCDHPDVDFLYREELEEWQAQGLVEVFPAFSRLPEGEVLFVQHRLWAERDRVAALLRAGARIYVCGDGRHMAPAVRETFARIHQQASGCSDAEAQAWLRALDADGRYLADVFA